MLVDELDYTLPSELIAQEPLEDRSASRLMVVHRSTEIIEETQFSDIGRFLRSGDVLVVNDARVLRARLFARKVAGGGKVELLLLHERKPGLWEAMVRPARRVKLGYELELPGGERVEIVEELERGRRLVAFSEPEAPWRAMEVYGNVPLPPYIKDPESVDGARYQTVYADKPGAVAAPTAGLHFTPTLLDGLRKQGVQVARVTLFVGPGTFLPLSKPVLEENELHEEHFEIEAAAARVIEAALEDGRRVIAIGTTSLRVLETLGPEGLARAPLCSATRLFLYPGKSMRVVSGLITNFHLPRTSLMALVATFSGLSLIRRAYERAVAEQFRFYSFGDAMLLIE